MSRSTKLISEAEIMFARSNACVAMESLRGRWHEMSDDWRAFTGGWCLGYSMKLDEVLARFGVELEDPPELEQYLRERYAGQN